MKSSYKFFLNCFTSTLFKKKLYYKYSINTVFDFEKKKSLKNFNLFVFSKKIKYLDSLKKKNFNFSTYLNSLFTKKKKQNLIKKTKKQNYALAHLTKKQLKRLKRAKMKKIIRPSSSKFKKYYKLPRNTLITPFFDKKFYLIHDGYSWQLTSFNFKSLRRFKAGSIAFKTRAISPISIHKKGTRHLIMKQKMTYKVKGFKVKRKK